MIISVCKEKITFLSCHSFQVETTMAASHRYKILTRLFYRIGSKIKLQKFANIKFSPDSVVYRIGSKIKLQKFVYLKPAN